MFQIKNTQFSSLILAEQNVPELKWLFLFWNLFHFIVKYDL